MGERMGEAPTKAERRDQEQRARGHRPDARQWFARLSPLLWVRPVDAKGRPLRPIRTEYRNSVAHIQEASQKPAVIGR